MAARTRCTIALMRMLRRYGGAEKPLIHLSRHHHHHLPLPLLRAPPHTSLDFPRRPFGTAGPSPPQVGSRVITITTDSEYESALCLAQDNGGLGVAYFTATWCGPCKAIAPVVNELSTKHPNVTFLKVDVDLPELLSTLKELEISSVPTFKFFKGGKSVSQLVGADVKKLSDLVSSLCSK